MVKDIDLDGNATVEFEEFIEMMEGKMVSRVFPPIDAVVLGSYIL